MFSSMHVNSARNGVIPLIILQKIQAAAIVSPILWQICTVAGTRCKNSHKKFGGASLEGDVLAYLHLSDTIRLLNK